jgi:hypothetical protein
VKESLGGGLPIAAHTGQPACPVCLGRIDESVDSVVTMLCYYGFHSACMSEVGRLHSPGLQVMLRPKGRCPSALKIGSIELFVHNRKIW